MKPALFAMAILICSTVTAQQKNVSISHTINDDGTTLSIKVKGSINDKPVDYNNSFDVSGMNEKQKDAIKRHIYDSLGLPDPTVPRAPLKPLHSQVTLTAPQAPVEPEAPNTAIAPTVSMQADNDLTIAVGGRHPYTKEIRYNAANGELFMKYRFEKNGGKTTIEKTIDAKDKTPKERDAIIKKFEKEIGVAQPEIV